MASPLPVQGEIRQDAGGGLGVGAVPLCWLADSHQPGGETVRASSTLNYKLIYQSSAPDDSDESLARNFSTRSPKVGPDRSFESMRIGWRRTLLEGTPIGAPVWFIRVIR